MRCKIRYPPSSLNGRKAIKGCSKVEKSFEDAQRRETGAEK